MKTAKRLLSPPRLSLSRFKSTDATPRATAACWSDIVKSDPTLENTFLTQCLASSLRPEFQIPSFSHCKSNPVRAIGNARHASFQACGTPVRTTISAGLLKGGERQKTASKTRSQSFSENCIRSRQPEDDNPSKIKVSKKIPSTMQARQFHGRNNDKRTKNEIHSVYKQLQENGTWPNLVQSSIENRTQERNPRNTISKSLERKKKKPIVSALTTKQGIPPSPLNVFKREDKRASSTFFEEIKRRNNAAIKKKHTDDYLTVATKSSGIEKEPASKLSRTTNNQHLAILNRGGSASSHAEKSKLPYGFEQRLAAAKSKPSKNPFKDTSTDYLDRMTRTIKEENTVQNVEKNTIGKKSMSTVTRQIALPLNQDVQAIRRKMKPISKTIETYPQIYPRGSLSMRATHLPIEPCRRMTLTKRNDADGSPSALPRVGRPGEENLKTKSKITNLFSKLKSMFTSFFRDK